MRNATDFVDIDGIGQEKSGSILEWYASPQNSAMFEALIKELDIEKVDIKDMSEGSLNGKTFVITAMCMILPTEASLRPMWSHRAAR